jgi:hypothetical protein
VFVGTIEGVAKLLSAAIPDAKANISLPTLADKIGADHHAHGAISRGSVIQFTNPSIHV